MAQFLPAMRYRLSLALLAALMATGLVMSRAWQVAVAPRPAADRAKVFVVRAVDGDTLLLAGGERVRLLGVDTPEVHHPQKPVEPLGAEAAAFAQRHVGGKTVVLEFDRERYDHYGRTLAFVSIDGWSLNEALVREGFSRAITAFPYSPAMKKRLQSAEVDARAYRRGLWGLK